MKPPPPSRLLVQVIATVVALLATHAALSFTQHPWLLPSLGGSCVILLGMPRGIMAQPRSFFGGHLLSTTIGIICRIGHASLGGPIAFWLALAVGLALAAMALTRSIRLRVPTQLWFSRKLPILALSWRPCCPALPPCSSWPGSPITCRVPGAPALGHASFSTAALRAENLTNR